MVVTLSASSVKTVSLYSRHYEHRRNISVGRFGKVYSVRPIITYERKAARCHLITRLEQPYVEKNRYEKENQSGAFLRTLLIDNYDSYTYNIYQELSVVNSVPPVVIRNDDMSWSTLYHLLYEVRAFDNVVISPGPGSPMCPEDTGICLRVLRECKDIPILGICLGHQALGYVHGANIIHASEPVHGRLSRITHNGCTLFQSIPSGRCSNFNVVRYHSLVIDAASLPREVLTAIAWTCSVQMMPPLLIPHNSDLPLTHFTDEDGRENSAAESENHAVLLMGIMHNNRPHYGLQFHPESVATSYGRQLFENFKAITINHMHKTRSISEERHCQVCRTRPKHDGSVNALLKPGRSIARRETDTRPLKLTWRKFESLLGRVGGAVNLFLGLFEDHSTQNSFWLDSSSTEKKRARFSFMGGKGGPLWKQITFRLSSGEASGRGGGYISIEGPDGFVTNRFLEDGFFSFLDEELRSFKHTKNDYEGLPFQFYGGYVGYVGYALKSECGGSHKRDAATTPDACFFFADNLVAIDHERDDVYLLSLRDEDDGSSSWLDGTERRLMALVDEPRPPPPPQSPSAAGMIGDPSGFTADRTKDDYMDDVEECLRLIREGESYELCLTTQMRKKVARDTDSMGVYLRLRANNPAPFAAWLNFPDLDLSICCSSPERFLRLDAAGVLETRPIKGTAPRGRTSTEDDLLRTRLQLSEKDRAENLMIVDLVRNDLGRVCDPGSVHVPRLMEVESHATVHTMVSTVRGNKRSDVGAVDCVRAAFPGGSMIGAPKLRSMAILDRIERSDRGIYSGCIGYFSYNSTFDLNIVIRTVVLHAGEASIGAGGAIVSLSHPLREYNEMLLKAAAPISAVSAQERCQSFMPVSSQQCRITF